MRQRKDFSPSESKKPDLHPVQIVLLVCLFWAPMIIEGMISSWM